VSGSEVDLINSSENSETLRKFGDCRLLNRLSQASRFCHPTDLLDISHKACSVSLLAHFLRGDGRGSPFVPLQTTTKNVKLIALSMQSVAP
jgi:hypothetical protein